MLSFPKLLVLVAVVAIVWFGFRWFQRWEKEQAARKAGNVARGGSAAAGSDTRQLGAEDMVACSICGAYVTARGATSCGRGDCPYPR